MNYHLKLSTGQHVDVDAITYVGRVWKFHGFWRFDIILSCQRLIIQSKKKEEMEKDRKEILEKRGWDKQ